jgi:hypothetical protein
MHAAINNTTDIVPSMGQSSANPFALTGSVIGWLTAVLLWVGAAYFLVRMSEVELPTLPERLHEHVRGDRSGAF